MNFRYNILTITHTQRTHTLTHTHTRAHTTLTCTSYHCKKSADKPINKLENITLSLLFWACPSVCLSARCRGHSNVVIFSQISSKFHIWIASIELSFKFEYNLFLSDDKQEGRKMAATTDLSNLVIIIRFRSNFIYGLLLSNSRSICS